MKLIIISGLRLFNRATTRASEFLSTKDVFANKFSDDKQSLLVSQR